MVACADFVDRQDSSLAFAAFGAANHHSFPLAVVQVSPEGLPLEFLLCFHGEGQHLVMYTGAVVGVGRCRLLLCTSCTEWSCECRREAVNSCDCGDGVVGVGRCTLLLCTFCKERSRECWREAVNSCDCGDGVVGVGRGRLFCCCVLPVTVVTESVVCYKTGSMFLKLPPVHHWVFCLFLFLWFSLFSPLTLFIKVFYLGFNIFL